MRSNTAKYAEIELEVLNKSVEDSIVYPYKKEILALVDKFGKSGQSGGSAPYTAHALSQAIENLCLQKPICPVMGIEEEWMDVSGYNEGNSWFQNTRCGNVFKEGKDGKPYYLDAIIWKDEDGCYYNGGAIIEQKIVVDEYGIYTLISTRQEFKSRQFIKSFPFEPKTFYIDVEGEERIIKDENQLKEVFEYYNK